MDNTGELCGHMRALASDTKAIFGGLSPVTNRPIWATLKPDKPALCFFNFVACLYERIRKASPEASVGVIHYGRWTEIHKSSPLKSSRPRSLALGLLRGPGENDQSNTYRHLAFILSLAWVVNVIKKTKGKPRDCVRCYRRTTVAFVLSDTCKFTSQWAI